MSWEFVAFSIAMTAVSYPFCGAILYGDPWTWIFKDE